MEMIPYANKPLGIKKYSFLKKKKCNGLIYYQHYYYKVKYDYSLFSSPVCKCRGEIHSVVFAQHHGPGVADQGRLEVTALEELVPLLPPLETLTRILGHSQPHLSQHP